ncbi:SRPBCC family protein [Demequina sp. TTPB684]|uniref:SRPBCC family protein n=1 Tax=unclassified Demequina TaxID=2620311 RepID=UPI001CF53964|nr:MULTISPECIES: SRPBCC family protein [unclassified Demequina]MCB2412248.1 SRPBCC family protein [Demequina sp. TTPB684]UPU87113.1 SRPBCC family protein [Demequina sp. TMPB413]
MAAHKVEAQRDILAEAIEVWAVLTDLDRTPKVLRSVERVERVAGEGYDVGVTWIEDRRLFGKTETETLTITLADPPRRTVHESESHGTRYRTEYSLHPSSLGTRLRVEFSAETGDNSAAKRLAWAVFGKLGAKATKQALDADLEDIAKTVESRATR